MSTNFTENAIMAKTHVLYGRRLRESDFDQLIQKKSVGEIAAYLKDETYYAENLDEVKEELIHREQLEIFVRRRPYNTYKKMLKYSYGKPLFMRLYIMRNEISQLLIAIRLLNSGSVGRYIITLPVHMAKLMSFDLFAIPSIKTYEDLIRIVEHSPYRSILGGFRPMTTHKLIDITSVEAALLTYYYTQVFSILQNEYKGDAYHDLMRMFETQLELHNISIIFRLRRGLGLSCAEIKKRLVLVEGKSPKFYYSLLDTPSMEAMSAVMRQNKMMRKHSVRGNSPSQAAKDVLHIKMDINQKVFRFSRHPIVTIMAYMEMLEIEVRNIVSVIEGVRYELPPADIKDLLCL